MTQAIDRTEGRRLFGADPALYHAARPEYPEQVYALLADRCGLTAGMRVFEVGPGPGQVTMRLLRAGARMVTVEPDGADRRALIRWARRASVRNCALYKPENLKHAHGGQGQ
jgi:16S rRNA A1518/A1519 N6-dimethyltransferase RsmA/KsgA/DIM1 with predicted DNA glycosylase/AP lyase activity